jgi:hypothetical protein
VVAVDDDAGADAGGKGFYHDAANGRLLAEHVCDPEARLDVRAGTMTRTIGAVCHFHVVGYGTSIDDSYRSLDFAKLYFEDAGQRPDPSQLALLRSFGTGVRQFLPTYWLVHAEGGRAGGRPGSCMLRVPRGLKARRSYELKPGLPKHHIYYLNFPGSPFYVDDAGWR